MMIIDALLLGLVHVFLNAPLFVGERILNGMADVFGGVLLLVIGVVVIIFIVAAAIVLLPAILVVVLILFVTGSFFYAGIAFLVVALISVFAMAGD